MKIDAELNHINLSTVRLAEMVVFYQDILGFRVGDRPPFDNVGAWMYLEDKPLIHLTEREREQRNVEPKINHFAFTASGMAEFITHLRAHEIPYLVRLVPEVEMRQVVIKDPDGNLFEVMFERHEEADMSPFRWPES